MSQILFFDEVVENAPIILEQTTCLMCPERTTGGYLCVLEEESGVPVLVLKVGMVPDEKKKKYFEFAQEKANRLWLTHSHFLSSQSRDESQNRFGGAIRTKDYIFSFSGLTEVADEAFSLALAVFLKQLEIDEAIALGSISQNLPIRELLQLIKK
jgi:hypothetical protein